MKYDIINFDNDKFIKGDLKTIELILKNVYMMSVEAINNNEIDSIEESFKDLSNNFERVGNYLEIEDVKRKPIFYYGMLYAIVSLIIELSEIKTENNNIQVIFNRYKLLYPILNEINILHKATGQELKRALNFKSESNLTNFVSRINKYNLLYIQKLGNTNYYSLTPKGKKYLSIYTTLVQQEDTPCIDLSEDFIMELLDEIDLQLRSEDPSLFGVIKIFSSNKVEIKNKNILKYKINSIFSSHEEYMKMKVKFSVVEYKREIDTSVNDNYFISDYINDIYEADSDNEEILEYNNC